MTMHMSLTSGIYPASDHCLMQAHGDESYFQEKFFESVDQYNRFCYASHRITNWGRLLANGISFVVATAAALSVMFQRHSYEPTRAALAMTNSFLLPYFLSITTYLLSATFTGLTSLERLLQFQALPQEPEWSSPNDTPSWPQQGTITFHDVPPIQVLTLISGLAALPA